MIIKGILIFAIALQHAEPQGEAIFQPSSSTDWKFKSTEVMSKAARAIVKKVLSIEQAEGVGARVRRSVGRQEVIIFLSCLRSGIGKTPSHQPHPFISVSVPATAEKPGPLSHVG